MLGWFKEGLQGTVSHLSSYFRSPSKGKRKRATEPDCSRDQPAKRPFARSTNGTENSPTEEDQRRFAVNGAVSSKLERRNVFSPQFRHMERRLQPVQQHAQQQQQQHRQWPQQQQQQQQQSSGSFTFAPGADTFIPTSHSQIIPQSPVDVKQPQQDVWDGNLPQWPQFPDAGATQHSSIQRPLNAEFAQAAHTGAEELAIMTPTAPIAHLPKTSAVSPPTALRNGLSCSRAQHAATETAGLPASIRQRHATVTRQHGTPSRRVKVHFNFQSYCL